MSETRVAKEIIPMSAELKALDACIKAFLRVEQEAYPRMLGYLVSRFGPVHYSD